MAMDPETATAAASPFADADADPDELGRRVDDLVQVVVVAGGDPPPASLLDSLHERLGLPDGWYVIAVDSGAEAATTFGWSVDLLVGDLDSVMPDTVVDLRGLGADVQIFPGRQGRHRPRAGAAGRARPRSPPSRRARRRRRTGRPRAGEHPAPRRHEVLRRLRRGPLGAGGVRRAHLVPRAAGRAGRPPHRAADRRRRRRVSATSGLRWPLRDAVLRPGVTWGVSNEVVAAAPSVTIAAARRWRSFPAPLASP